MASVIQGHRNPFGKALRDYTVAQLDFVLEMAALDNPDQYSFNRGDTVSGRSAAPAAFASWHDVLRGQRKLEYLARIGLSSGIAAVAAWRAKQHGGLRPGLSRGGKPVEPD